MAKQFVHALIVFTYTCEGNAIPSRQVSHYLAQTMPDQDGRHLESITTYQVPYAIDPVSCGLKHSWLEMTDEDREEFSERYSDLATAIALMCGDNEVVSGERDVNKEKPGTESNPGMGGYQTS